MIKVLLVDDDSLFLELLEHTLSQDSDVFQVVGKFDLSADIVNDVKYLKPNILIVGIHPNNERVVECIETICKNSPEIKVIALSVSEDGNELPRLISAGISSYLLKNCSIFLLAETIYSVVTGIMPKASRGLVMASVNKFN